jgi:hypothetical protein
MMKKVHLMIGLAVLAMFALSAVVVSSASAASKILLGAAGNGTEITASTKIEVIGSLLLEDMGAPGTPDILCTGIFDGKIEAGGTLGFIEELLTAGGVANGNAVECVSDNGTCEGVVLVSVQNLPWHIELILDAGGQYLTHFLSGMEETGKEPTYVVDCIKIFLIEDACRGLSSARLINTAEGLLGYFNSLPLTETWGAESEAANCSDGGAGQGLIVSVTLGADEDTEASGGLIQLVGGGGLSVSE